MKMILLRFIAIFLVLGLAAPHLPVLQAGFGVTQAEAQQRKSLFDVLFERRQKKLKRMKQRHEKIIGNWRKQRAKARQERSNSQVEQRKPLRSSPAIQTVQVEKNENARKLLVIGDFMGGGLASGLEQLYAANPDIVIVNATRANSGLVRDDVIDWPSVTPGLIEEHKPIAVLSLVGMNDRQAMRLASGRPEKLSESWTSEYKKRIGAITTSGVAGNIPVLWVGLPPVKLGRMNADYLTFNEMYRSSIEAAGGTYVDVWDGFTNAEGKFVSAGPDINGQIVRLRGSKGINMTRAGKEKLAFFADKELKRLGIVGLGQGANFASLGTLGEDGQAVKLPEYDPVGTGKTIVISLGSPALDGGDRLEGEKDFLKAEEKQVSVSKGLVQNGVSDPATPGRIDSDWGLPAAPVAEKEEPETKDEANLQNKPAPREQAASLN